MYQVGLQNKNNFLQNQFSADYNYNAFADGWQDKFLTNSKKLSR